MARQVYRGGRRTATNFTPRLKDLERRPGQSPGLSTFDTPDRLKERVQVIDLDLLELPLCGLPDCVEEGGTPGHVAIAPVTENGDVDMPRLQDWAQSREKTRDDPGYTHELTQLVLDAVIDSIEVE